jgi:IS605 OrfB family transposase
MIRSVPISLNLVTDSKKQALQALIREVRSSINFFCKSLWNTPGKLNAETLKRFLKGSLSYRHRSNALKIALETVSITKKNAGLFGVKPSIPISKNAVTLSSLVCKIEPGKKSFDYVLKVSGLKSGKPIVIPFKSHKRLNYWLAKPGASFKQGAIIDSSKNRAILWVNVPQESETKPGKTLGVDIGKLKMLATSTGEFFGTEFKQICDSARRKKPGSKAKKRSRATREYYINKICKMLPWPIIGTLKIENLKNMKRGKKSGRGKKFRKAMAPWTYRKVSTRLTQLAQENRVRLELVNPKNTSRTCPQCGLVAKENRVGEMFKCVCCNYTADADYVGALNISYAPPENSRHCMVAGS